MTSREASTSSATTSAFDAFISTLIPSPEALLKWLMEDFRAPYLDMKWKCARTAIYDKLAVILLNHIRPEARLVLPECKAMSDQELWKKRLLKLFRSECELTVSHSLCNFCEANDASIADAYARTTVPAIAYLIRCKTEAVMKHLSASDLFTVCRCGIETAYADVMAWASGTKTPNKTVLAARPAEDIVGHGKYYIYLYLDTDIADLSKMTLSQFCRSVFYVGKGVGGRKWQHLMEASDDRLVSCPKLTKYIKRLWTDGTGPRIVTLYGKISEAGAYHLQYVLVKSGMFPSLCSNAGVHSEWEERATSVAMLATVESAFEIVKAAGTQCPPVCDTPEA